MTPAPAARLSQLLRLAQWRTALFSLVCASLLLTLAGLCTLCEYETRTLELVARSLAFAGEPALRFNDRAALRELIDKLASDARLSRVDVVDRFDRPWLRYERVDAGPADRLARTLVSALMPRPVTVQVGDTPTPLGRVALHSDGHLLLRYAAWTALSFLLCGIATLLIVRAYSRRLAARIVAPIDALATLTRAVRESRSLERRARHSAVQEIDALADDFNALLIEMQAQQALIEAHHAELRRSNEALRAQSRHDALTQLPNRAYLGEHLDQVVATCRAGAHQAGLVFIDTDRFKQVNDRFGHAAGDALLVELSKRLRASVRDADFVARLGGDEFIIVVSPLHDVQEIGQLTERIRRALDRPVELPAGEVHAISVTMGVAVFPDHADSAAGLIKAADEAMYVAKGGGPGSIGTFRPDERRSHAASPVL